MWAAAVACQFLWPARALCVSARWQAWVAAAPRAAVHWHVVGHVAPQSWHGRTCTRASTHAHMWAHAGTHERQESATREPLQSRGR
eukprot:5486528-Alexandrium_andersonii.AAC.1